MAAGADGVHLRGGVVAIPGGHATRAMPIDQTDLMMTERHGVEIDYCPKCRGVWLDRGEIDKIIDRASDAAPSRPVAQATSVTPTRNERDTPSGSYDTYRGDGDNYEYRNGKKKKKRGSFLEDLFDF